MKEELTTLTEEEASLFEQLQAGYYERPKCLDAEYEGKVIGATKALALKEFGDDCGLTVFITHGQDLQVWLAKGYHIHRDEMNEIANNIVQKLKRYFGFDFEHRQTSPRSIGMIIAEEQTQYYFRKNA